MAKIKNESKTKFAIHEADAAEVRQGFHDALSPNVFGIGVEPDVELVDGQNFQTKDRTFQITHVPGHSPGSMCIRTKSNQGRWLLFSGDSIHGIYAPKSSKDLIADFEDWARALERVLDMDVDLLFEGHVMPLMPDITQLGQKERETFIDDLLSKMDSRRQGCEDPKTLINQRIFLLKNKFLALPDYYISKACNLAG